MVSDAEPALRLESRRTSQAPTSGYNLPSCVPELRGRGEKKTFVSFACRPLLATKARENEQNTTIIRSSRSVGGRPAGAGDGAALGPPWRNVVTPRPAPGRHAACKGPARHTASCSHLRSERVVRTNNLACACDNGGSQFGVRREADLQCCRMGDASFFAERKDIERY